MIGDGIVVAAPDAVNAMLNNATLIVDNEMVKRRTAIRRQPKIAQPTIGRSHSSPWDAGRSESGATDDRTRAVARV